MPESEDIQAAEKEEFDNLDLKSISYFGMTSNKLSKSLDKTSTDVQAKLHWPTLAKQIDALGLKKVDKRALEKSFAEDVEVSYFRVASFTCTDLDTDITWHASFVNARGLWELEILNSPDAPIEPEQMKKFFSSELFKETARRVGSEIDTARGLISNVLGRYLEEGMLLDVDEIKLSALMHWISDTQFMENLRTGKFMNI